MKYDHVVKHNGIYYEAGEMVPDDVDAEETIPPLSTEDNSSEPVQAARRGRPAKKQ